MPNPGHVRVSASRIEGARDWLITFHDKKDKKMELKPFRDQPQKSEMHTKLTVEQAKRALWRAQYINASTGKKCKLWLFTAGDPAYVAVDADDVLGKASKEEAWEGIELQELKLARDNLKRVKRERVK